MFVTRYLQSLFLTKSLVTVVFIVAAFCAMPALASKTLDITPIPQLTPEWCWLAVLEMVFKDHDVPNGIPSALATSNYNRDYQVAIVAHTDSTLSACRNYNYQSCVHGAGNRATKKIGAVLYDYPKSIGSTPLIATTVYHRLTPNQVRTEIDGNRPIIAGVNTSGFVHGAEAEHAVLVVGYDDSTTPMQIIINDPFDYNFYGAPNPWNRLHAAQTQVGQYEVPFD